MFSIFNSDPLDTAANASNIAALCVNIRRDSFPSSGCFLKKFKTFSTSQMTQYLGFGGRFISTPLIASLTKGCSPTLNPSTGMW